MPAYDHPIAEELEVRSKRPHPRTLRVLALSLDRDLWTTVNDLIDVILSAAKNPEKIVQIRDPFAALRVTASGTRQRYAKFLGQVEGLGLTSGPIVLN
jgi:hypothetical protein